MAGTMSLSHGATSGKSVTVKEAAELLNKSQQFVRVGLQRGILPFGSAVKLSTKWTYYISPSKLRDYAGLRQITQEGEDTNVFCG